MVNGYKDTFLDRRAMERSDGDLYKPGTTFENIYDLFIYDRMLRQAVMPYLIGGGDRRQERRKVYAFCDCNRGALCRRTFLTAAPYVSAEDMLVPGRFPKATSAGYHNIAT
ncbi:MAG: hypothetical protein ACLTSX_01125 [Collinsella sp.]